MGRRPPFRPRVRAARNTHTDPAVRRAQPRPGLLARLLPTRSGPPERQLCRWAVGRAASESMTRAGDAVPGLAHSTGGASPATEGRGCLTRWRRSASAWHRRVPGRTRGRRPVRPRPAGSYGRPGRGPVCPPWWTASTRPRAPDIWPHPSRAAGLRDGAGRAGRVLARSAVGCQAATGHRRSCRGRPPVPGPDADRVGRAGRRGGGEVADRSSVPEPRAPWERNREWRARCPPGTSARHHPRGTECAPGRAVFLVRSDPGWSRLSPS